MGNTKEPVFEELMAPMENVLLRMIYKKVGSADATREIYHEKVGSADATREIYHEVYLTGLLKLHQLRDVEKFPGWIIAITRNAIRSYWRSEKRRQAWEAIHRGPGNAFRVAVLDLGLKYQPISMTNTDAQFVESNEVRVADVCRFFGVPLHLAYAGKQSYQSNEQNGIEYVNYTLLGYETQWDQEDTYKLLLALRGGEEPPQESFFEELGVEKSYYLRALRLINRFLLTAAGGELSSLKAFIKLCEGVF